MNKLSLLFKIRNVTFFNMVSVSQTIEGITSKVGENKHFLLWDIEDKKLSLDDVIRSLSFIQNFYQLSDIYITSDKENSYHAFCFNIVDFKTFLRILLDTNYVDWNFIYWTVQRGKATMRMSMKKDRLPQKIEYILRSYKLSIPKQMEKVIYDTGIEKEGIILYKRIGVNNDSRRFKNERNN